jgi:hypothetical protein
LHSMHLCTSVAFKLSYGVSPAIANVNLWRRIRFNVSKR